MYMDYFLYLVINMKKLIQMVNQYKIKKHFTYLIILKLVNILLKFLFLYQKTFLNQGMI